MWDHWSSTDGIRIQTRRWLSQDTLKSMTYKFAFLLNIPQPKHNKLNSIIKNDPVADVPGYLRDFRLFKFQSFNNKFSERCVKWCYVSSEICLSSPSINRHSCINDDCRGHRMVWCNIWTSRCPSCGVPGHQQFLVKRPMTGFCWWLGCLWEISGGFNITFNDKS